jgi:hypothetical protein
MSTFLFQDPFSGHYPRNLLAEIDVNNKSLP